MLAGDQSIFGSLLFFAFFSHEPGSGSEVVIRLVLAHLTSNEIA